MVASSIHCIFTVYRDHIDERRNAIKKNNPRAFLKKPFANSRSIDGSNPCIFRVHLECIERIHREYVVAMVLREIDRDPAGDWRNDFGRREPWGAPTRTIKGNKTTPTRT